MDHFYTKLAEAIENESVQPGDVLADFPQWDSLTILCVIAMVDSSYGVTLTAKELQGLKTAGDLADWVARGQSSRKTTP
jgi:acyl carrier protein